MRKKIKIGAYVPRNSLLHKCDARVKLLGFIAYVVVAYSFSNLIALALLSLFVLFVCFLAKLNPVSLVASVKWLMIGFVVVTALNLFFTNEGDTIAHFFCFTITDAGIERFLIYGLRLVLTLFAGALLLACTSQIKLCEAVSKLLSPLQRAGVPISQLSFILCLALRFVPDVYDEFKAVCVAQKLRGASFTLKKPATATKSVLSLFLPTTLACIRKSEGLSFALLSKNFVPGAKRTDWDWENCKKRQNS